MTISFSHAPSGLRSTADVPEHGSDVIVLPETVNEGQGIYRSDLDSLVKLLRSDGIDASYGHPAEQRSWRVIEGEAPLDIAIAVASSFVASGAWALLVYSLGKWLTPYKDAPIHVDFAIERSPGLDRRWVSIEGGAEGVAEALSQVLESLKDDPEGEDGGASNPP